MFRVDRGVLTCQFDDQTYYYDYDPRDHHLLAHVTHYGGLEAYLDSPGAVKWSLDPHYVKRVNRTEDIQPHWRVSVWKRRQVVEEERGVCIGGFDSNTLPVCGPVVVLDRQQMIQWLSSYLECYYYQTYRTCQTVTAEDLSPQSRLDRCTLDAPGADISLLELKDCRVLHQPECDVVIVSVSEKELNIDIPLHPLRLQARHVIRWDDRDNSSYCSGRIHLTAPVVCMNVSPRLAENFTVEAQMIVWWSGRSERDASLIPTGWEAEILVLEDSEIYCREDGSWVPCRHPLATDYQLAERQLEYQWLPRYSLSIYRKQPYPDDHRVLVESMTLCLTERISRAKSARSSPDS